jgi:phosphatidylserine decarboxylase
VRRLKIAVVLMNVVPMLYAVKLSDSTLKLRVTLMQTSLTRRASYYYGCLAHLHLPESMRSKTYRLYSWVTGADLAEVGSPLEDYRTIGEFFARELRPGARTISGSALVCPCDGKVLSYGEVKNDVLEHIKGGTYSLTQFLTGSPTLGEKSFRPALKSKGEGKLYYVTFYLAPGDYHRFHAPADFEVNYRSHMHGYLLGVFGFNLWRKNSIFEINERVVYFGKWSQGLLTFVAVGAYNVGSILVNFDTALKTNQTSPASTAEHLALTHKLVKGQEIGSFNMGSSIVLVFEGPPSVHWEVSEGESVKMGQGLVS